MKLVFVHGFNVRDNGKATIDTLKPFLSDHKIFEADYGLIGLIGVRTFGKKIARIISGMTPDGAIGIGHSNGCMELIRACEMGAPFDRLIFINPALDNDVDIPAQLNRVDVLHNLEDDVVTLSKWLPWHYWGDMGKIGYTGLDARVHNHETQMLFNVEGHSGVFSRPEALASFIQELLDAERN